MMSLRSSHGFTLIELLTVMAIMTLVAGGFGMALRDGSPATALESAQGAVASLVSAARSQAILHQSRVVVLVAADPAEIDFLRSLQIATETAPHSGQWRIVGESLVLPKGIYVVPGSDGVEGVLFPEGESANPWAIGRRSSLFLSEAGSVGPILVGKSGKYLRMSAPLTAQGSSGAGGGDKLILTVGQRTLTGVVFDRPERVRGVALSAYGVAILINDGPGFDF